MVIKYLPCRVVDRIIHFNFITYLLQAYETRPININFWWRMKGNGGYWPKVLMVQKPKWLDWCLSRTFWEPCSVAMPWIFRKPSNREGLFVILVRCQVDLGLEISPPTQISLDFNLPLSLFKLFPILSKVEFQPGCSLIRLFNTPLLITYHTLRSVKHGGWISEYDQALTVLWWGDGG